MKKKNAFVFLTMTLFLTGCYKKVDSYLEIQKPNFIDHLSKNEIKLKLNIDADAISQYDHLSVSDKVRYVLKWGYLTSEFIKDTGFDSLSEYKKVEVYVEEFSKCTKSVEFTFDGGEKYTVLIGGARGGDR